MAIIRPTIEQTFFNISVSVTNTVTSLQAQIQEPSMIQAFMLCNPSSNANSVFFGDQNVSTTTGIELVTGSSIFFNIIQDRQMYELQDLGVKETEVLLALAQQCADITPIGIPVIVWNPSNIWLIAGVAGPTLINAMLFRNVYT